nr:MAG TPA: hypothetical protein [Caudoviricetes sp.]
MLIHGLMILPSVYIIRAKIIKMLRKRTYLMVNIGLI